jgi:hypothetical protein
LAQVPAGDAIRVERAGSSFAWLNGPLHAWAAFCEELLGQPLKNPQRSHVLWTLAKVTFRSGDLSRAASLAREKADLDRMNGEPLKAAIAMGGIADVLEARGDLEEALRIRREEELPVYEESGDVWSRAVTMGQIADVPQARWELEEAGPCSHSSRSGGAATGCEGAEGSPRSKLKRTPP